MRLNTRHPLARGLRALWLPSTTPGAAQIVNRAVTDATGVLPFSGTAPLWRAGQAGPGLGFTASTGAVSRTAKAWTPLQDGADFTIAIYAEIDAYPASGAAELFSTRGDTPSDGTFFRLGLSGGSLRGQVSESTQATAGPTVTITQPALKRPFLAVFTSKRVSGGGTWDFATDAMTFDNPAYDFAGTGGGDTSSELWLMALGDLPSVSTSSVSRGTVTSQNPTTETLGAEILNGVLGSRFQGTIYGAWQWSRSLDRDEIQDFLTEPFGLLEPVELGYTPVAPAGLVSAPGATLTSQWSLSTVGTVRTDATVQGTLPATQWSLSQIGVATAPGDALTPSRTLSTSWVLAPGTASAGSTTPSRLLSTVWSLIPGIAAPDVTAPGALVSSLWRLFTPFDPQPPGPVVPNVGGSLATGFGGDVDPEVRRKVRLRTKRAAAELAGEEFWPDPEDLSPEELEEWAAKAEAAQQVAPEPIDPYAMVDTDVEFAMAEADRREAEALFLLTAH